ncbi:MAG TPA: sugar kinase [Acidothermaceae bacterium]|nr:sugar kinase [Acidothermaceae bacterium]
MSVDLVTLGETMGVLAADEIGPLRNGHRMVLGIAGAESNVAIGVSRLGHRAAWIGRVGADQVGRLVMRELRGEGVDVECAVTDSAAANGLMLKVHRTTATSEVIYARRDSAGSRLSPADVPAELVSSARVLHVTGVTPALSDTARAAVFRAIELARSNGVPVSFDVNHRARLWSDDEATAVFRTLVKQCDIVFASEHEAALIVGRCEPADAATRLTSLGPRHAVIKRGELGYTAVVDGQPFTAPAVPVPVADPVGAGDAFVAGYLASWLAGASPSQALDTANLVGAFAVAVPGDWEGLPTREELVAFAHRADAVTR